MEIALIGFGNVGKAFLELLTERKKDLAQRYKFRPKIVAVVATRGSALNPRGFTKIEEVRFSPKQISYDRAIKAVDVVVEVTPTNVQTGGAALTHCRVALKLGKHVVTANKGPLVLAYPELQKLARRKKVHFRFEGTVMGGTPSIVLGAEIMASAGLTQARGIFNGTTNFILTEMEAGGDYASALATAQARGYAETDPTADVEGWDAAAKAVIIANTIMGGNLRIEDVERTGITHITPQMIVEAKAQNSRWKLIAQVTRTAGAVTASVRPTLLPFSDPLALVNGTGNAITYVTEVMNPITLIGSGAGGRTTAFALLTDLLKIHGV